MEGTKEKQFYFVNTRGGRKTESPFNEWAKFQKEWISVWIWMKNKIIVYSSLKATSLAVAFLIIHNFSHSVSYRFITFTVTYSRVKRAKATYVWIYRFFFLYFVRIIFLLRNLIKVSFIYIIHCALGFELYSEYFIIFQQNDGFSKRRTKKNWFWQFQSISTDSN